VALIYPEFRDFCEIAADILGTTPEQIERLPNVGLAASALATPSAGFGRTDAYPTLLEKAAVLLEHLARNCPLLTATSAAHSAGIAQGLSSADPDGPAWKVLALVAAVH
jgi:prophage maintenance system killer protein